MLLVLQESKFKFQCCAKVSTWNARGQGDGDGNLSSL